ncbi:MAG: OmpA family protein [Deltaproteobacteria bacterium]|nr:OmpA family protein [Deltaproteobacteria bacterium]
MLFRIKISLKALFQTLLPPVVCLWIVLSFPGFLLAGTGVNEAVDAGSSTLLNPSGPVTVTSSSGAATSALAEIDPPLYLAGTTGAVFTYDISPVINAVSGDTGVNALTITSPPGYMNLAVSNFSIDGSPKNPGVACPAVAAGEYCATVAGQTITIIFGDKIMLTGSVISTVFSADLPGVAGNGDVTSTVDDLSTPVIATPTAAGNADGDNTDSNSVTVNLMAPLSGTLSTVTVNPTVLTADGIEIATITVTLRDGAGQPVAGKTMTISSDRGIADIIVQPAGPTDILGRAVATIRSNTVGVATLTATDVTDSITLTTQPTVYFTKGEVLILTKEANKREASIGEVVTYTVTLANSSPDILPLVTVVDPLPPNFKYLKGSTRLNGVKLADPAGNKPLLFSTGAIPALLDTNGNGRADPGEAGFMTLSYQTIIGSGALPGKYINGAVATDVCSTCYVSNKDEAEVAVVADPYLDVGTIIGKVFHDKNGNRWQDKGEEGVSGAMVALDDGTYIMTDDYGRYHFPALRPGQRLLKINLQTLPGAAVTTTGETKIVTLTEGLIAKANFGVRFTTESETIGSPAVEGLSIRRETIPRPVQIIGNVESFTLLVNGQPLPFSTSDVLMRHGRLSDIMEIKGGELKEPVRFKVNIEGSNTPERWFFTIWDDAGAIVHSREGRENPPPVIEWDGMTSHGSLPQGGKIYQYQMTLSYKDGSASRTARRFFGVNRISAISLKLRGSAFGTGSAKLSNEAKEVLKKAAELIKKYPGEKVFIEGHSDSMGSAAVNLRLSEKRAESARNYLINDEGIDKKRLFALSYGETRPIADNKTPEGREINRRVEIKGTFQEVDRSKLYDQYRTAPFLKINSDALQLENGGRFRGNIDIPEGEALVIEALNSQGKSINLTLMLPSLEISAPPTPERRAVEIPGSETFQYTIEGRTEAGNELYLDGIFVPVSWEGRFRKDLLLENGENRFGLILSNSEGVRRVADLIVTVSDRDEDGLPVIVVKKIPQLTVNFPPPGAFLEKDILNLSGKTAPGNRVYLNGKTVPVERNGYFSTLVRLPAGKSTLDFRVEDEAGNSGTLQREVNVPQTKLFFLAFADGKMGKLTAKGNLEGAGMSEDREYYTEGRLAYYLKGMIAGKYLISSAFDSDTRKFERLFNDLDESENDRFFTNLDADKLYPVYGDTAEPVYDNPSQGKFYLAIKSDEVDFLIGNYPLDEGKNELTSYRRTLFGGRFIYQSASKSRYGDPDTKILLFGAGVRQVPVRDEFRATGSALYYLSRREIIEGSEQVTIVVRDKNTGLVLSRSPRQQNIDYRIKYEEGRLLFNGPISTVSADTRLVDSNPPAGNPVYIEVNYESRVDSFEKTALGIQAQKQLGDHLALGGTLIKDELKLGRYELKGLNTSLRMGEKTKLTAEIAQSEGANTFTASSRDGGMTFTDDLPGAGKEGQAWKITAQTGGGGENGSDRHFSLGTYIRKVEEDFISADTSAERGTSKFGIKGSLELTDRDYITGRFDRSRRTEAVPSTGIDKRDQLTLQWLHKRKSWNLTTEYFSDRAKAGAGGKDEDRQEGALRLENELTKDLKTYLEQQLTMDGPQNDQTSAGFDYRVMEKVTLSGSGTKGSAGSAYEGGAVLNMGEGKAYLTKRLIEDRAGRMNSTIVGAEEKVNPSTRIYTEYQWAELDSKGRNISLVGAEKSWKPAKGFKLLFSGERSEIESDSAPIKRYSLWAHLYYSKSGGLKVSTKNGMTREGGGLSQNQYLTSNHIEFRLTPDFTFLADYRWSETRDRALDTRIAGFRESSAGIAYRPVESDRFNALMRYTRLKDERQTNQWDPEKQINDTEVLSAAWSLELNRYFEWVEKEAIKRRWEKVGNREEVKTETLLSIHRINLHITKTIDMGTEYRTLRQKEAKDERKGWLAELSWEAVEHLRMGVGYNFTDFSDNEFSDNSYSVEGPFVRLQAAF